MMHTFDSLTEELKKQLDSSRQNWLFGAGVSVTSNIPLMYPLTERVIELVNNEKIGKSVNICHLLKAELEDDAHIEHYLSHLGDLIALADRAKHKSALISSTAFSLDDLRDTHRAIISFIGQTVRYGYSKSSTSENIGTAERPIVEIQPHIDFVNSLFKNRSNLLSRSKLTFFTTNYDTLLEDALGLMQYKVIDGFTGGVVGYWNPSKEFTRDNSSPRSCELYKLHGSIDWHKDKTYDLVRIRYGTKYLADPSDIMIYPQATKYVETQRDPFALLFSGLRNALNSNEDNILVTCGYSFGDEHINAEIESALKLGVNRTTLIAFTKEVPLTGKQIINSTLDRWLSDPDIGSKVYVAGEVGLYNGGTNPISPTPKRNLNWWTFSGLTDFILTGDI